MDYNSIPPIYKNYLPSKKIIILIGIAIAIILAVIVIKNRNIILRSQVFVTRTQQPPEPLDQRNTSSQTSFLGDGIPDWQKLLVGLDPKDPASTQEFLRRKQELEREGLWQNIETFTADNQVGISIGNNLLRDRIINDRTINQESSEEIIAYIEKINQELKTYTRIDIEEDAFGHYEADEKYLNQIDPLLKEFSKLLERHRPDIELYFEIQGRKPVAFLSGMSSILTKLLVVPVPSGPKNLHLQIINNFYGMYQIIDTYDTISQQDSVTQFAYVTLFQTKLNDMINNFTLLATYMALRSGENI